MALQYNLLLYVLLQSAVIAAVLIALIDLAKRAFRLDDLLAFGAGVLALGVLGYLSFWLAYANYALFGAIKIAVLVALVIHFAILVYLRRLSNYRWAAEPLVYAFLFFLIIVTLGFSDGGIEDPITTAQSRFSHTLPRDNEIPLLVASGLKAGHLPSPLFGDWLSSDRPPLQTGLYLFLALRNIPIYYQIVASWLQATFLFGVWGIAAAAALPVFARRIVLLACCLLSTAIINTFYVWPKMIAVSYLLLAFALLFCRTPRNDRERVAIGVLIGGLAALAILAHGSSFFALIGFTLTVVLFWAWPPLKSMIYGAATLALLYVPWMLYQQFVDPPGNRLVKWHIAGIEAVDARSVGATLRDSYGALSWHEYVTGRFANLETLIGVWPTNLRQLAELVFRGDASHVGQIRAADFFNFLTSLQVFSIALMAAIVLMFFMRDDQRQQRAIAQRLLVALEATLIGFAILIFLPGQTINHIGSYATQVMAALFAFMVLVLRTPLLAALFVLIQAAAVAATYAFTLHHDPALWPLQAVCTIAAVALFGYSFYPRLTRAS